MEVQSPRYYLKLTVYISLIIQALTAVFNIGILALDSYESSFSDDVDILVQLIWLGLIVQIIEGTFYVWLATYINTISNITSYRYYDWFFSTPTMLITFVVYLLYLKEKDMEEKDLEKNKTIKNKKVRFEEPKKTKTLWDYMKMNKEILSIILGLNAFMLIFGYLGEINVLSNTKTVLIGFVPFIAYFYLIYDNFAKYTDMGKILFWLFSSIWSLYGISALLPYYTKNISYNILDIVSKNFFEIFIGFKLLMAYNI